MRQGKKKSKTPPEEQGKGIVSRERTFTKNGTWQKLKENFKTNPQEKAKR